MKLTTDHTPERKDEKERYCHHDQTFYGVIAAVAIEMERGIPSAAINPQGLFASIAVHSHYLRPDFLVWGGLGLSRLELTMQPKLFSPFSASQVLGYQDVYTVCGLSFSFLSNLFMDLKVWAFTMGLP